MLSNGNTKFGIRTDKHFKGMWSFCIGLSHFGKETYLYINFFRWSVSIGLLYEEEEEYFVDEFKDY